MSKVNYTASKINFTLSYSIECLIRWETKHMEIMPYQIQNWSLLKFSNGNEQYF